MKGFEEVENVDAKVLWQILAKEHPQTLALILAHISPKKSGQLMSHMPSDLRSEVLMRVAMLDAVDPNVLDEVAEVLAHAIELAEKHTAHKIGGTQKVADILALMEPTSRQQILDDLAAKNPQTVDEIKSGMFTFNDLRKIDRDSIITLLAKVAPADLELALRDAPDQVKNHLLSAMSARRAEQIKENIAAAKPVSKSKVNEAQRRIATLARELVALGVLRDPLDKVV